MTESAESPQIGPDKDNAGDKTTAKKAASAPQQLQDEQIDVSYKLETRYPGKTSFDRELPPMKLGPAHIDDDDDDEDGPVIRRIPVASRPELALDTAIATAPASSSAPRLFARQLDDHDHDHDYTSHARISAAARAPAPAPDEWYDDARAHGYGERSENLDFSVAAIRAKRMRAPAGSHKPTSMATKATVFSLASVCLVAAGVSLGLYGQDLKYHIERQVELASVSVQDAWSRLAATGTSQRPAASGIGVQANAGGGADLLTGSTTTAPSHGTTGRKLIYKRLPGAEQSADADPLPAEPTGEQPETVSASNDPFGQLLATPADFATVQSD